MSYHDLNVPMDDVGAVMQRESFAMLLTLGYTTIAAVHSANGQLSAADRCTLSPVETTVSPAAANAQATSSASAVTLAPQVTQLTRLTFGATDPLQAQHLSSSVAIVRSYDLVAVQPKSERVLQQACGSLEVDIISLDLAQRLPFKLRLQTIQAAVKRGLHFEICYASALRDSNSRRMFYSNAQALVRATRGKAIVLSSGARHAFELRAPLDIANLATLFGLSMQQAKAAQTSAPQAVVQHALRRRMHAGALLLTTLPQQVAGLIGAASPHQPLQPTGKAVHTAAATAPAREAGGAAATAGEGASMSIIPAILVPVPEIAESAATKTAQMATAASPSEEPVPLVDFAGMSAAASVLHQDVGHQGASAAAGGMAMEPPAAAVKQRKDRGSGIISIDGGGKKRRKQ